MWLVTALVLHLLSCRSVKPIATLSMWSDEVERRNCRIQVYDGECSVEMRAAREVVFTLTCANLTEAFERAELLRRTFDVAPLPTVARRPMTQHAA
jgi:hypothetical protein